MHRCFMLYYLKIDASTLSVIPINVTPQEYHVYNETRDRKTKKNS